MSYRDWDEEDENEDEEMEPDEAREHRISMEIIVDAYDPEEQAMGWYYYLDEHMVFPFSARCIKSRSISPLKPGERVKVVEMAPVEDCDHEMFVMIQWRSRLFGVPLMQLESIKADEDTQEAIADWHYWVNMGREL